MITTAELVPSISKWPRIQSRLGCVARNIGCTKGLLVTLVCLSAEMRYVYGVHYEAWQFTDMAGAKMRMGKGKGSFDHWAARIAINQVLFEIKGILHEQVIRDAFRLAGNKLPGTEFSPMANPHLASNCCLGQYEFVKKGDPAVVGITKLDGVTLDDLRQPWKKLPAEAATPAPSTTETSPSAPPPS